MSEGDTGWSRPTAGFFLRISLKKGILVLQCGRCPLCRWSVHLRRCRGTAIPLHCRILFSVFAGTRSGFGKFCFVFNTTSPFCPRPLRPYFARDMIGKRTRTSPFLLDFQGVSGFVLIITYGHTCASLLLSRGYSATLFKRKLRAKAWKRAQNRLYNLIETRKYGESMVHS